VHKSVNQLHVHQSNFETARKNSNQIIPFKNTVVIMMMMMMMMMIIIIELLFNVQDPAAKIPFIKTTHEEKNNKHTTEQ